MSPAGKGSETSGLTQQSHSVRTLSLRDFLRRVPPTLGTKQVNVLSLVRLQQSELSRGFSRMWSPGHQGSKFCFAPSPGSEVVAWGPLLGIAPRKRAPQGSLWAADCSPCTPWHTQLHHRCPHTDTLTHPAPAPGGLGAARASALGTQTWRQAPPPHLSRDPKPVISSQVILVSQSELGVFLASTSYCVLRCVVL